MSVFLLFHPLKKWDWDIWMVLFTAGHQQKEAARDEVVSEVWHHCKSLMTQKVVVMV